MLLQNIQRNLHRLPSDLSVILHKVEGLIFIIVDVKVERARVNHPHTIARGIGRAAHYRGGCFVHVSVLLRLPVWPA